MNYFEKLGADLARIRKQNKYSICQLAIISGVSKSQISEIERGIGNPTYKTLWNIAEVYGGVMMVVGSSKRLTSDMK